MYSVHSNQHDTLNSRTLEPRELVCEILWNRIPIPLRLTLRAVPLRRAADPDEIFLAVKFIIECDFFTGRCIDVDGGQVV